MFESQPTRGQRPLFYLSKERTMNRTSGKIVGAALIIFTLGGGAALAQGTMAQQYACRPDVFRLCGSYIPDVGQIVACLRGNEARLSEACHQVMFTEPAVSERYAARSRARSNQD
jgi:hypothetical protein